MGTGTPPARTGERATGTLTRTAPVEPAAGSALDPLVEEVSGRAWRIAALDPGRLDGAALLEASRVFASLVETAWRPGRTVLISELAAVPAGGVGEGILLEGRLYLGALGAAGTTVAELDGLVPAVRRLGVPGSPSLPLRMEAIDPAAVVPWLAAAGADHGHAAGPEYAAVIRQRAVSVEADGGGVDVVSRFNPTVDPWSVLARVLRHYGRALRVRATVLATTISPSDRMQLDAAVRRLEAIRGDGERTESALPLERALSTLVDLQLSLTSPLLIGEIAVTSPEPLPDTLLRGVGGAFTSELEVVRRPPAMLVASQRRILGGFDVERDPVDLAAALARGLPLRGGLRQRELRDLLTLTEQPIGLPLGAGALPGVPTDVGTGRPGPGALRPGPAEGATVLGTAPGQGAVALPLALRTRHVLLTGTWGSGKTTVLTRLALDDLRSGRGFVFVCPHGQAADYLIAFAEHLGIRVVVLDADDGAGKRLAPLARLAGSARNRARLERQIGHLCDALASSLPDPQWAGPRWYQVMSACFEVQAAHGADFAELVTWMNDGAELRARAAHPAVGALARSTVGNVARAGNGGDSADVRAWASSKLHALVTGPAQRLLARPGRGVNLAAAVESGTPVIVNLGGLPAGPASLVGHLTLAAVLDAAMSRPAGRCELFSAFVDEAQRFPVAGSSRILAEGRKFGVGLVLACQSLSQLDPQLGDLAQGCGTRIVFRSTPDTAARLAPALEVDAARLRSLPDLRAVLAVQGQPSVDVDVPPYEPCPRERVKTRPRNRQARRTARREPPARPTEDGGSFLDEWLARRRGQPAAEPGDPLA